MGIVEGLRLSGEVKKLKKKIKALEKKMPIENIPTVQEAKAEETTGRWNS